MVAECLQYIFSVKLCYSLFHVLVHRPDTPSPHPFFVVNPTVPARFKAPELITQTPCHVNDKAF